MELDSTEESCSRFSDIMTEEVILLFVMSTHLETKTDGKTNSGLHKRSHHSEKGTAVLHMAASHLLYTCAVNMTVLCTPRYVFYN